ncbi:MAG: prephenate dehydrogenase [Dehalococcoidales bacterium]|nr:MAG: prephenate dehydrogenase [Dehalococcoidales bacterium]
MKVAIVGGSGKMGQWFARLLHEEGKQVLLTGRSETRLREVQQQLDVEVTTDIGQVRDADAIMISVPLDAFESVVKQVAPHTNSGQVVVDVTSLKVQPVDIMHRYITSAVTLGMHPVFGPGAKSPAKQNFVLTPTNEVEASLADKVKDYLEAREARVALTTPQEHDKMMTIILGLAHFIAIVSADTLLHQDRFQQMKEIGSTTYKVLYTLIESVISEDPELYASLQMSFPDISEIEEQFLINATAWADLVRNNDRHAFANRMSALKEILEQTDPHFQKAYDNMYKISDGL